MTLVTDKTLLYTNAATDPYTGNLNNELQTTLTAEVGEANYDIGHLFHKDHVCHKLDSSLSPQFH